MSELQEIEDLASRRFEGNFTPQGDALVALGLIARLARAVRQLREDVGSASAPPMYLGSHEGPGEQGS